MQPVVVVSFRAIVALVDWIGVEWGGSFCASSRLLCRFPKSKRIAAASNGRFQERPNALSPAARQIARGEFAVGRARLLSSFFVGMPQEPRPTVARIAAY